MWLKSMFTSGTPESITRVAFALLVINFLAWEWYAIVMKTTVPNIAEWLGFAAVILGVKQFMEVKGGSFSSSPKQGS